MVKPPALESPIYDELAARAVDGDSRARRQLLEYLWSTWRELVRASRSMGPFATSDDHVDNVVGRLVEKLAGRDGTTLRQYLSWKAAHGEQTFADWLRIVTKNAIRDYIRGQLGTGKPAATGEPSIKRLLNEFATSPVLDELRVRPPITAAQTARELLEFAVTRLPKEQLEALRQWLEGASFEEIGAACGISGAEAQKRLRAGIAVLRRHFGHIVAPASEPDP
jgi:DNA-directed RNA polymerase specialized sigma24 family protein